MAAKELRFDREARDKVLRGVDPLANAVRVTVRVKTEANSLFSAIRVRAPRARHGGREPVAPAVLRSCLLYTSPSPRDGLLSRMPSSA